MSEIINNAKHMKKRPGKASAKHAELIVLAGLKVRQSGR